MDLYKWNEMKKNAEVQKRKSFIDLLNQDVSWKSVKSVMNYEIHVPEKQESKLADKKKDKDLVRFEAELTAKQIKLKILNDLIKDGLQSDDVSQVKAHAEYRKYILESIKKLEKKIALLDKQV